MKAFQFSLEKILELREFRLKEVERKLAEKVGRCLQLESAIARRLELQVLTRRESANLDFYERWTAERYISRLVHEIQNLNLELNQAIVEREKVAEEFRKALAEKKSLENVKSKVFERYRKESKRWETLQMDDQFQSFRGEP